MQPIINEILTILQAEPLLVAKVTTFYESIVVLPPKEYLPAVMVDGINTKIVGLTTASDQYTYSMVIKVVLHRSTFYDEAGSNNKISAKAKLREIAEWRESDGRLKKGGILYELRNNVRGVQYLYNNDIDVNYPPVEESSMYVTAELTFDVVTDLLLRP